jgi:hypothetical protein
MAQKSMVYICKADPITRNEPVPDMILNITNPIPDHKGFEECKKFHQEEAERLAQALFESLPQGTRHELIISLMQREVNLYRGV